MNSTKDEKSFISIFVELSVKNMNTTNKITEIQRFSNSTVRWLKNDFDKKWKFLEFNVCRIKCLKYSRNSTCVYFKCLTVQTLAVQNSIPQKRKIAWIQRLLNSGSIFNPDLSIFNNSTKKFNNSIKTFFFQNIMKILFQVQFI